MTCKKCGKDKPFAEFTQNRTKPNPVNCKECDRTYQRDKRRARVDDGRCGCGKKPLPGQKSCQNCIDYQKDRRKELKAKNICQNCYKNARVTDRSRCEGCLAKQRNKFRDIRYEVITEYGGQCQCCGESEPDFLSIDHIYGGGAKHRREIRANRGGGLYTWLKRMNFPKEDYQLLCFNCNCSKGFYGSCPHTRKELAA